MDNPKILLRVFSILLIGQIMMLAGSPFVLATDKSGTKLPTTTQPKPTPPQTKKRSIWEALLSLLKRDEPPLASRGRVCPMSPGLLGQTNVIWRDRPLFAWQGQIQALEIRPYSLTTVYEAQPLMWQTSLTAQDKQAIYLGTALQPGQKYDWQLTDSQGKVQRFTFQMMEQEERDRIAAELKTLENRLSTETASREEIALNRAQYFAERQLWSDALQEVYTYPQQSPSAEFTEMAQQISKYLCS
ncbi:MAG: hypothetical protein WCD18_20765 [Thermosynechococcaceae cyanobacterium]